MFGKENLRTSAYFVRSFKNFDSLAKRAPTWLGRLAALALIAIVANEEYHIQSSPANILVKPGHTQELELAPFVTLSISAIANYSNHNVEAGYELTTTPTQVAKFGEEISHRRSGELSPITGYYCQQVPGYPVGDGGGYCGTTASGEPAESGVAACGYKWELGTKLVIEGFGQVTCLDRGHLGWDQVDIFFPTNRDLAQSSKPDFAKVAEVE